MKVIALALLAAAVAASPAGIGTSALDDAPRGFQSMAEIQAALVAEARQAAGKQALPRHRATARNDYAGEIVEEKLLQSLLRPADRDTFVDAYVRWQLTSFEIDVPTMSQREFETFLNDLPALAENPRANVELVRFVKRAAGAGELSDRDAEQINALLNQLASRSAKTAELNRPALELREWFMKQSDGETLHVALLQLERIAAMVEAGWNVEDRKRELEDFCDKAGRRRTLTVEEQARFAAAADRATQTVRVYVADARLADKFLAADYGDAAMYDFDVRRWMRLLEGPQP